MRALCCVTEWIHLRPPILHFFVLMAHSLWAQILNLGPYRVLVSSVQLIIYIILYY